jgi:outer membrane lipoprotein-sorting protein
MAPRPLLAPTPPGRRPGSLRIALSTLLAFALVPPLVAMAETPTGRQIMEWVDERDDGDDGVSDLEMILIDKRGNERVRSIRQYSKDKGEDTQGIMFFLTPADVKDTGFLSYDYDDPDKDDDQWLYLPALKKTKRIASGDKSGSFMGSDFTYSDMSSRVLERYEYTLMKETEVNGVPVWQVEAIPNEKEQKETGYTKSIVFVRKDNHVVVRSLMWVKKGKRNKYMEVKELEQIDGIWVPTHLTMTTKKGKATLHRTVIKVSNVQFNQGLEESKFSVRQLEKGL